MPHTLIEGSFPVCGSFRLDILVVGMVILLEVVLHLIALRMVCRYELKV